eukprot:13478463-Ditylum_brightwellii.AAC.1
MPVEVREVKLALLQIRARLEYSTGTSNKDEDGGMFNDGVLEDNDNDDNKSKDLLGPAMAQPIPTESNMSSKKDAIKLENKGISESEDFTDMSAFKVCPFKTTKA